MFDTLISLCVYIISVHLLSMFSVSVCAWAWKGVCCLLLCCQQRVSGLRGFELIFSSSSSECWFSPVPPGNILHSFQFRIFSFFMRASIHLKLRSHPCSWSELGFKRVVSLRGKLSHVEQDRQIDGTNISTILSYCRYIIVSGLYVLTDN